MSRKKPVEQKLVECIKELGLVKSSSIFKVLEAYNEDAVPRTRKPKLVKSGETAS